MEAHGLGRAHVRGQGQDREHREGLPPTHRSADPGLQTTTEKMEATETNEKKCSAVLVYLVNADIIIIIKF